jgi:hypothetical protein
MLRKKLGIRQLSNDYVEKSGIHPKPKKKKLKFKVLNDD